MSDHHHHHHHHHSKIHDNSNNILFAFLLNFSFVIVELIAGVWTNSMAIYSDALHDLGDCIALLFSYIAEKLGHRRADQHYTYGYRRFSVLAALINGIILFSGGIFIIFQSVSRILAPEAVRPEGMLAIAILGIAVNGFAAFRLSKGGGPNQRMVMLHLVEDVLGWIGVLIVSVVLLFYPLYILDSILSVLISLIIMRGVYGNMLKVGAIFLQRFPSEIEIDSLVGEICLIEKIQGVHAIRGWSIDGESFYLGLHIEVDGETKMFHVDAMRREVDLLLKGRSIEYSSIVFESLCHEGNS